MAQYDVVLTQNTAAAGTEYTEKIVSGTSGTLFGFDSGGTNPTNITVNVGLDVDGDDLNLAFEGLGVLTSVSTNSLLAFRDTGSATHKAITFEDFADSIKSFKTSCKSTKLLVSIFWSLAKIFNFR